MKSAFLAPLPLMIALILVGAAAAVMPEERLSDPMLEARARALSAELRCLVCQNQSLDDSDADLARDLRIIVRERIQQGDTDAEVKAYLVARYGDFVLLRPPFKSTTIILWVMPLFFLVAGLTTTAVYMRRRRAGVQQIPEVPLSADERARLDQLTSEDTTRS